MPDTLTNAEGSPLRLGQWGKLYLKRWGSYMDLPCLVVHALTALAAGARLERRRSGYKATHACLGTLAEWKQDRQRPGKSLRSDRQPHVKTSPMHSTDVAMQRLQIFERKRGGAFPQKQPSTLRIKLPPKDPTLPMAWRFCYTTQSARAQVGEWRLSNASATRWLSTFALDMRDLWASICLFCM